MYIIILIMNVHHIVTDFIDLVKCFKPSYLKVHHVVTDFIDLVKRFMLLLLVLQNLLSPHFGHKQPEKMHHTVYKSL